MDKKQIIELEDLFLELNADLAILNSALKDSENLEICTLTDFVERAYQNSEKIKIAIQDEMLY